GRQQALVVIRDEGVVSVDEQRVGDARRWVAPVGGQWAADDGGDARGGTLPDLLDGGRAASDEALDEHEVPRRVAADRQLGEDDHIGPRLAGAADPAL